MTRLDSGQARMTGCHPGDEQREDSRINERGQVFVGQARVTKVLPFFLRIEEFFTVTDTGIYGYFILAKWA